MINFALSFKTNYGPEFSYYSIIYVICRQFVRLCDFEDTLDKQTEL